MCPPRTHRTLPGPTRPPERNLTVRRGADPSAGVAREEPGRNLTVRGDANPSAGVARGESFDASSPYHTAAASAEWPTFDQAKATQLVDAYRAGGGNPDFVFKTTTTRQAFAEFLQAQMAAIGIHVTVQTYDLAQFSSSVLQGGDFQLTTWVGPFDNPDPGASRLLHSGGNGNYGKYANPQVDQWLDDAAATQDPAQRTKDYQQVELQVNKDLVVDFFSRSYLSTITKKDVKGMDRFLSRDMWFAGTWLDR
ncbi:hypothetical protein PSD17_30320 [Pseudonocardia sp. D17]|nr:hypothetical protein PSD17_30320 [Pseudonocardia sp. D17]